MQVAAGAVAGKSIEEIADLRTEQTIGLHKSLKHLRHTVEGEAHYGVEKEMEMLGRVKEKMYYMDQGDAAFAKGVNKEIQGELKKLGKGAYVFELHRESSEEAAK